VCVAGEIPRGFEVLLTVVSFSLVVVLGNPDDIG
jgi:hypothetical protein